MKKLLLLIAIVAIGFSAKAQKISALPVATQFDAADLSMIVQAGTNKSATKTVLMFGYAPLASPLFTTQISIGGNAITAGTAAFIDPTSSIQTQFGDITSDIDDINTTVEDTILAGEAVLLKELTENAQTGTTYTLVLTDAAKRVTCTNAAAITLTVPPNVDVAFKVGTQIIIEQWGAGAITFAEGSGVTINSLADNLTSQGQYGVFSLVKDATNVWILGGPLE